MLSRSEYETGEYSKGFISVLLMVKLSILFKIGLTLEIYYCNCFFASCLAKIESYCLGFLKHFSS